MSSLLLTALTAHFRDNFSIELYVICVVSHRFYYRYSTAAASVVAVYSIYSHSRTLNSSYLRSTKYSIILSMQIQYYHHLHDGSHCSIHSFVLLYNLLINNFTRSKSLQANTRCEALV